jgi:hypothetical protein
MKTLAIATVLAAALLAAPTASRADVEVVPYGADGWRYRTYPDVAAVPADWATLPADDAGFSDGAMPFGSRDQGGAKCPLASDAATLWPSPGVLVAQRTFTLPRGSADARLWLGVDNNALVAVNGTVILDDWIHHETCPARDDFFVDVPRALLNRSGPNVVTVLAHDSGVESWLDVRVAASDPGPLR